MEIPKDLDNPENDLFKSVSNQHGMAMKFQSKNLHQHILNVLYKDRSMSDTNLRVMGQNYPCHAGVLAASSSLLQVALNDAQTQVRFPK